MLFFLGLPRLSADLLGKAWQDQAVRDVQDALKLLMGRTYDIIVVHNSTRRVPDAEVTYTVKLTSVEDSKAIRRKSGTFFLGSVDKRPPHLKHLSIKNRVTGETKIRIDILKLIARKYRVSNPGSKVQVISYEPRPLIKITPAASASDRRIKVYNFVEAVRKLPTNFTPAETEPILRRVNPELLGRIRSLFVVLSDDQFKKRPSGPGPKPATAQAAASETTPDAEENSSESESMESDPVPPAQVPAPPASGKGSRSQKRGASSSLVGPSAKK